MKLIYIASPYAGDVEANVAFAKLACRYAISQGHTPIAHLLYPQMLDDGDPVERELGLRLGSRVLRSCDELWAFGDYFSAGMRRKMEEAGVLGLPIRQIPEQELRSAMEPVPSACDSVGQPGSGGWVPARGQEQCGIA